MVSKSIEWEIQVYDDVSALEKPWQTLEKFGCCTAFQSYGWCSVWYRTMQQHRQATPVIVAARRGGAAEIEVILPLCRVRRPGHWEITFADMGVTDFVAPVFMPAALPDAAAVKGLMAAIAAVLPQADILRLDKICPAVAGRRNPLCNLPDLSPYPVGVWGVPLSLQDSDQPPRHAKRRLFWKARRKSEEMSARFARCFQWIDDPEEIRRVFAELVELRVARFAALQRPEILQQQMWLDFYRSLIDTDRGKLRAAIATVTADGKIVAAAFGVLYGRAFHYLVPGFAMAGWGHYVPGLQLIFDLMRECPGRGIDYLDLTIGDERYKKDVGAVRQPLYETRIPLTFKGQVICCAWRLKIALKAHPKVLALVQRLFGRQATPSKLIRGRASRRVTSAAG